MINHTKGPWYSSFGDIEGRYDVYCSEQEGTIAQNARGNDATLIAAAPDMLIALRELVAEFEQLSNDAATEQGCYGINETGGLILARAAIAQATIPS